MRFITFIDTTNKKIYAFFYAFSFPKVWRELENDIFLHPI